MKKHGTLSACFILSFIFISVLSVANDGDQGKNISGRFIYPQVGFWEFELKIDGLDDDFGVSSDKAKALLCSNEKGKAYYDNYQLRSNWGNGLMYGGFGAFLVNFYVTVKYFQADDAAIARYNYINAFSLVILATGAFIETYAKDDLYLSINEYNKQQVNGKQSGIDRTFMAAKNIKF